ncbi:acyl-CoA thioesterase [Tateyamaria omphalii]|uniref:acyl-CoA thioesterase n=1 Tax=Tateyamaria omphalii TaxID=299262 RepID=UPI001C99127B|nr:thioesterase family protein [Tateyamaria omphalii]MBY5932680.1 acyl-CoA thioesterase [Tateyamaria omphalii]
MTFEVHQKVLFRHCDPAGIVFFPRYFEMINDSLEAFFDQCLGTPWEGLLLSAGVPTAEIKARFTAPSRHGDILVLRIMIDRVGRTSMSYDMTAHAGSELRFEANGVLVHVDANGKPTPWPDALRRKLQDQKEEAA